MEMFRKLNRNAISTLYGNTLLDSVLVTCIYYFPVNYAYMQLTLKP